MIVKQTPHQGDIYTLDYMDQLSATGAVDNKVCIWNAVSGTIRSIITMPRREGRPNIFVSQVRFFRTTHMGTEGYPATLLLVAQNNGDLFIVNPLSESISKRITTLSTSPCIDYCRN
jgi:hypothetical protein